MINGYVVQQAADENCVGSQNQSGHTTVIAESCPIHYQLNVHFQNLFELQREFLRHDAIACSLECRC